jgi:hypothetical protein
MLEADAGVASTCRSGIHLGSRGKGLHLHTRLIAYTRHIIFNSAVHACPAPAHPLLHYPPLSRQVDAAREGDVGMTTTDEVAAKGSGILRRILPEVTEGNRGVSASGGQTPSPVPFPRWVWLRLQHRATAVAGEHRITIVSPSQ